MTIDCFLGSLCLVCLLRGHVMGHRSSLGILIVPKAGNEIFHVDQVGLRLLHDATHFSSLGDSWAVLRPHLHSPGGI